MRRRRKRKRRKVWRPPPLTEELILGWADAYHDLTGCWPRSESGTAPGPWIERWSAINVALQQGHRGLPGGSSLPRLLAEHRGVRSPAYLPPLSAEQVLAWADAFHERTGEWPKRKHGREVIPDSGGETWSVVTQALTRGLRGLPGGSSLADLLAERCGVRNIGRLPPLTEGQILAWADAYFAAHSKWPTCRCPEQVIPGTADERWFNVHQALRKGLRSLPGGSSLADLLAEHRGVRNPGHLPPLTEEQILAWADAYFAAHGKWPTNRCPEQVIPDTRDERWFNVDQALRKGLRGLPGGSSLPKLLAKYRGVPNQRVSMMARMPGGKRAASSTAV